MDIGREWYVCKESNRRGSGVLVFATTEISASSTARKIQVGTNRHRTRTHHASVSGLQRLSQDRDRGNQAASNVQVLQKEVHSQADEQTAHTSRGEKVSQTGCGQEAKQTSSEIRPRDMRPKTERPLFLDALTRLCLLGSRKRSLLNSAPPHVRQYWYSTYPASAVFTYFVACFI